MTTIRATTAQRARPASGFAPVSSSSTRAPRAAACQRRRTPSWPSSPRRGSGGRSTSTPRARGRHCSRERLLGYLETRAAARVLLVGEAPGYRGARVSGIPFTSERQLTGIGPAESTATIVHRVLRELELEEEVLPLERRADASGDRSPRTAGRRARRWLPGWLTHVRSGRDGSSCPWGGSRTPSWAGRTFGIRPAAASRGSGPGWLNCSIEPRAHPVRRNTFLLSACLVVLSGVLQLAVAVATITLVLVTGIESILGLGPAIFITAGALAAFRPVG